MHYAIDTAKRFIAIKLSQKFTTINGITSASPLSSWTMTTANQNHADRLLAEAWIETGWSFNSVSVLQPFASFISRQSYSLPGRTKLTEVCDDQYDIIHECLMKDMKDQSVSITTDAATLTNNSSYITVTGHYITAEWFMRDVVLAIEAAPGPHTGDNIRDLLEE